MLDRLPTPFGLVRAGVAPDHPKIKNVIRRYEKTAGHEAFRFFGHVSVGADVSAADLGSIYNAVIWAYGAGADRQLGIPGEDLPGSHAATEFVAWYNGHPDFADRQFDLSCERVVVIGNGNVAADVARMLVLPRAELETTDTADFAIEALSESAVEEVVVLGRRGPAQAAFTNPEVRELGELTDADVAVDPDAVAMDELTERFLESESADATNRKNLETLHGLRRRRGRRASPSGSSCASCAARSRSTAPTGSSGSRSGSTSSSSTTPAPCGRVPPGRPRRSSAAWSSGRSATSGRASTACPTTRETA